MRRFGLALAVVVLGCSADPASEEGGGTDEADSTGSEGESTAGESESTAGESESTAGESETTTGTETGTETDAGTDTGTDTGNVGSPGCGTPAGLEEGEQQFMLDGYARRYILRLPQNYDPNQPWPLIFALHGNGGAPDYWDQIGGDRDIRTAFAEEAILVIPEAINNAWRDYDAPPETWPEGIELELNYFDTIHASVRDELCIDEDQVFSMGFSGGGSFSGVLGCRREYIRAIAVGGSVIYFEPEQCVSAPAAWITIGDGELTPGREAYRDFFRDLAGCSDSAVPGEPVGCVDYEGCDPDTPVRFCSHPADHVWPSIGTDETKAFFQQFYAG